MYFKKKSDIFKDKIKKQEKGLLRGDQRGFNSLAPIINRQILIIKQETTKFTFNT